MDINSITNSLNSVNNNLSHQQISKSNETAHIQHDDAALSLSIKQYNQKRDELSNSLQTFNKGIGLARVAQKGLSKEQNSLENIKNVLSSVKENQNNNLLKNGITSELQNFKDIAYETRYNRETLLSVDDITESTIIISTKEAYYSIEKPNTPLIASAISQDLANSDLNNSDDVENVLNRVNSSINTLNNVQSQFEELNNSLQESAKEAIQSQVDLSTQNRKNRDFNFQKDTNNFSKTNISSNNGYFVTSQANIEQEQSVMLLT